ncbi:MAG: ribose-phosphate pyrophosphokinase [Candidatus Omnitrophica bacterium]|nr:ribose-phosphate pyrophosphokinase [Candidatus Omnitrophota bacterium]MBU1047156.1 ribose-phosphate pyrophosphokinase [Candidatus Omnitrophota bacterium]MBU1631184.1 ribose-phosphate pyrophosphokinase [Candidatus Omnitrophota bacterium]MBU1889566.1 ribose-phosphate pyrophosphokinase [Candidatus Omnitrophota bacterium]
MSDAEMLLFSGNANKKLAEEIAQYLDIPLSPMEITNFVDGEIFLKILENVRGTDAFVIQPTCPPVNDNIMELLFIIDALKRASARRITAVIPYYGYARQDRKTEPRVPISAKVIANILTVAGASRVLVIDLHVGQIQGFFDIPVDHLFAAPLMIDYIKRKRLSDLTILSPDTGGVERARAFAKRLEASLAIIDKRRPERNVAELMHIVGDIEGRNVVIVDDMIDTGGTIIQAAETIKKGGAKDVYVCSTHGVFSKDALNNLQKSVLKEIIVTNTIPQNKESEYSKLQILSIAPLLGEAIKRIHNESSVSSLFV